MLNESLSGITGCRFQAAAFAAVFFAHAFAAGTVSAATVEAELIAPSCSVHAPLYPRSLSSISSIVTVEKGCKFKLVREVSGGFIVEGDDGLFMAPAPWHMFDRLCGECANFTKNPDFDASGFAKIKLPDEIESSEFFFNNASARSFHSLAFLLYLKNGPGFDGYEQKLRDYDDLMAAAAKKKASPCFLEAFCDFFNAGEAKAAVCMKRRLTPQIALGLLEAHKPAVFITGAGRSEGEIVVAYSASGREGFEKRVECYIYGRGLVGFEWREFERLLERSSNIFMALL